MTIRAKSENGVLKPLDVVDIKEGTIVEVHVPCEEKRKPSSTRDLGFAGMWAHRDDIMDGLSYVNCLRDGGSQL
ncbi:MAG TPA: antitoxin family protein [Candidatus Sulfopaludibacter sp.]|nr:antitoxin family protein [Candidatus Sulfopaludibacter sp.]